MVLVRPGSRSPPNRWAKRRTRDHFRAGEERRKKRGDETGGKRDGHYTNIIFRAFSITRNRPRNGTVHSPSRHAGSAVGILDGSWCATSRPGGGGGVRCVERVRKTITTSVPRVTRTPETRRRVVCVYRSDYRGTTRHGARCATTREGRRRRRRQRIAEIKLITQTKKEKIKKTRE